MSTITCAYQCYILRLRPSFQLEAQPFKEAGYKLSVTIEVLIWCNQSVCHNDYRNCIIPHARWIKVPFKLMIDFLGQMPLDSNCYIHPVSNALGPRLFISTDDLCIILWNIPFLWNSCGDCRQIGIQRSSPSHISSVKSGRKQIRKCSADRKLNGLRI